MIWLPYANNVLWTTSTDNTIVHPLFTYYWNNWNIKAGYRSNYTCKLYLHYITIRLCSLVVHCNTQKCIPQDMVHCTAFSNVLKLTQIVNSFFSLNFSCKITVLWTYINQLIFSLFSFMILWIKSMKSLNYFEIVTSVVNECSKSSHMHWN